MRRRIIILSGYSLFAEGVANRLQEYLQQAEFEIVDPKEPDAIAQITAAQPSVLILDVSDVEVARFYSLNKLLRLLPQLKIIRLDPQREQIQVVTSRQFPVTEVNDLIEVIKQAPKID